MGRLSLGIQSISWLHVGLFSLIILPIILAACAAVAFSPQEGDVVSTSAPVPLTYTDADMGLAFSYPDSWELEQDDQVVMLSQGTDNFRVDYTWLSEQDREGYFRRTGARAGEFINSGKEIFMGEWLPIQSLVFENKHKADFFNGIDSIERGDLAFVMVLEDLSIPYEEVVIGERQSAEARAIVRTFEFLDASSLQSKQDLDQRLADILLRAGSQARDCREGCA